MNRFSDWNHETLAQLAQELCEQNAMLQTSVDALKRREKILMATAQSWCEGKTPPPKVNDDPSSW